ncbi:MAG: ACT domain-containing protein [bacterium]|jgi:hypothetical protein|nr:ACT domain-containing protein [bacterium]MDD3806171.1 ACT domain-containing protein [bacterium]MDD4152788.1 ACT domain-containing protein [bacterium]
MHTRELSVFVENKAGRLAVLTKLLGQAGINIRGFSVADMSDYGIVRLIVDKPDEAAALLRECDFIVRESSLICVRVPDQPGGLSSILNMLSESDINVEYMYAIVDTLIVFNVENPDQAERLLLESGVKVVSGPEVYSL